ncbi:hypothetical protein [Arthrobacter sp. NA-172]|uniref:FMN-binding protein n=1 Tax=Arthrobacter sp. NA-172 TaxID=3367524 RepID=UPI0037553D27
MTTPLRKSLLVGAAGLSLAGSVAGCAPAAQGSTQQNPAQPKPSSSFSAPYKDGTYSADGNYVSPNGDETLGVQLTLSGNTVSKVDVTVHPTSPNTQMFQSQFKDGIAAQVVGKKLDDINVSKVAGSSLTGGGFNQAVELIKAKAK